MVSIMKFGWKLTGLQGHLSKKIENSQFYQFSLSLQNRPEKGVIDKFVSKQIFLI